MRWKVDDKDNHVLDSRGQTQIDRDRHDQSRKKKANLPLKYVFTISHSRKRRAGHDSLRDFFPSCHLQFYGPFFLYWINITYKHEKVKKSGQDMNPQVSEHKQHVNQSKKELFLPASHFICSQIFSFVGKHLVPRRA